jgi:L-aspartate oxidase
MVFGARAGRAMSERRSVRRRTAVCLPAPDYPEIDDYHLRRLATETCGLTRDAAGLRSAIENLCAVRRRAMEKPVRRLLELRSLHTVLLLIARCALAREESRGGHYRSDFPEKRPEFQKHSFIQKDLDEIVFQ